MGGSQKAAESSPQKFGEATQGGLIHPENNWLATMHLSQTSWVAKVNLMAPSTREGGPAAKENKTPAEPKEQGPPWASLNSGGDQGVVLEVINEHQRPPPQFHHSRIFSDILGYSRLLLFLKPNYSKTFKYKFKPTTK